MTAPRRNIPRFSRYLWLTLGMFVVFAGSFVVYVRAEKHIDRANERRYQSFVLAEELRQSSDDLTRMVRTYVVTGDPIYKQHYQEILDIRDGRKARPVDYENVYWDLVLADDHRPRPSGEAVPLLDLMKQAGFTEEEFAKLAEAKANSDALTRPEFAAMALVESSGPSAQANRDRAISMLHDEAYHRAKAGIMGPIRDFQGMADQRTLEAVHRAEAEATRMRFAFILFGLLLAFLLWRMQHALHEILGGAVDEVHARIARLGSGDFSSPVPVAAGMENSVLGWLSETQGGLARIAARRNEVEAKNQRLTQLYAALSQCNQAIVRCTDEAELFDLICRDVVTFGGLSMAWIGLLDPQRREIKPVACFGRDTAYLLGLRISVEAADSHGNGPSGRAFRGDQPVWCQDFKNDPTTLPWRADGIHFGWGSSAALPLHRKGEVVGVFTIYADQPNVFDEAERNLLLEMVMDIDYALASFDREALRAQAEEALKQSELHLRTIIETEPECIKLVDSQGRLLQMNRAGLAMLEADSLAQAQSITLKDFIVPEYRDAFFDLHNRVMHGESGTLEFEITGLAGTRRWLETHAAPMRDAKGETTMLLGVTRDITARKEAEARIHYLAHFDALTGLPNRTQLEDRVGYAISLSQRSQGPVALMFLDLDHFKDINDTLGHSVGDALLVELARRLRLVLREEDTLSRLGGDEFIFLLHGVDAQGAAHVARKVLEVIAEPYRIESYDLNVTGSLGIALYPDDGKDLETLSKSADAAMYRAKQEGRNGFCFFTAEMQEHSARHLQLVNALRQ
ncbi:MAG: diguanylate cyclase, partial [Rhodocyclaceae bacterium]